MTEATIMEPISILISESEQQLRLCDRLENIADRLPYEVGQSQMREAITAIMISHRNHVYLQEILLFPELRKNTALSLNSNEILEQAEREHSIDEDLSHEISDALDLSASDNNFENPELLGYMIRSQFETQRRHIAWERIAIFPMVGDILSNDTATVVAEKMSEFIANILPYDI